MSVQAEITRLEAAKAAIKTAVESKGVTVPDSIKLDGMAALIDSISSGAVQPSKSLTITSNGTTTITPDKPYDALKKVDVTVNVASGGGSGETTSLKVSMLEDNTAAPIYCLWQTSKGWMGTGSFDTTTSFTLSNVIVGGYVIFTHDPSAQSYFEAHQRKGVESFLADAMDSEWDVAGAALIIKVTAPSPEFVLRLSPA